MNVTPLVDVVLVLLIIFMVVLPEMDSDVVLELPSIFNVDEESRVRVDPLTISISETARLYIEGQELSQDELRAYLETLHTREPTRRVVLRADASLGYSVVRDVFRLCQTIGFPGVALRVGARSEEG
jgi:biopolymer transport protein ExbD